MATARIYRNPSTDNGTFGILWFEGKPLCLTLERPWDNNRPKTSCIPPGLYHCIPHSGAKFKHVWELQDVPGRSAILIHAGNTIADIEGCLLIGRYISQFPSGPGISESQKTLAMLRGVLPERFDLEILDPFSTLTAR